MENGTREPAQLQEPMADIHVGDIGELRVGNFQELGKLHAVGGRLIEHNQKFRICQHGSRGVGLKHIVHVLRYAVQKAPYLRTRFHSVNRKLALYSCWNRR